MAQQNDLFKKLVAHCKEYGFIYQSSEIYDGLSAVYDYGPYGVELKNNLKDYWWKSMVQMHDNIVGLDSAIFMHPKTWKASGHVDAFNDPLIDNKDSKRRFRADVLIEEHMEKIEGKIDKEITKARKRFGDDFDEAMYRETNPRVSGYVKELSEIEARLGAAMSNSDLADLKQMIEDLDITDPDTGSRNWTEVRQFNLMFSTQLGNIAGAEGKLYLRPETAQGIFVNFLNVQKTTRQKLPFGIAQIGKAFRNEIVARQFIFRMREFEQMEMQYFIKPGEQMKWYEYWKETRLKWHLALGTPKEMLRFHDHGENLAHYADAAADIQFNFPFGFKELEGIHSRTDFDLGAHQELSGKKLQFFDPETKESYVPYVLETSIGCDRMFLATMSQALQEETVTGANGKESTREVLKLHPALSPIKCAILPLKRNDERLVNMARDIFNNLRLSFNVQYDDTGSIGKLYRRQDAIGTPFCVTVDFEALDDQTVTLRDRDTLEQERVHVDQLEEIIRKRVDMKQLLVQ
ncbi:glycine--tRNA ligase [Phaeodactylibacter xiamenensis]|uniref:Glycine--tRNA ligase n=1 Tax=Phaeodactylibacter xiamenensis TaxID=1524460 RepID=A0A098SCN0_9BACT|nr:glycine--tRNA ligase [Phaeodactylibacter xiamenensis]KGE89418.1 glycyl-tRNA synthetease [Phaeodactylibacter xiamenensis]MCR9051439.1 glycine--tRNA ligase [bacterium]